RVGEPSSEPMTLYVWVALLPACTVSAAFAGTICALDSTAPLTPASPEPSPKCTTPPSPRAPSPPDVPSPAASGLPFGKPLLLFELPQADAPKAAAHATTLAKRTVATDFCIGAQLYFAPEPRPGA